MHDRNDDADEHGHKDDRFAPRAEPDDDERSQSDLGKGVEDDDVRLKDAAQRVAPPERKRDGKPEDDGDRKAGERLPERHADMVKEAAVRCEICERRRNAGRGTHDEGVHPAHRRDQFPQPQKQREDADAQRPDEGKVLFAPP